MLPVSGVQLSIGEPTSRDELFVLETALAPLAAVVELGRRVARQSDGSAIDWERLPATDVAGVALSIRRAWLGDGLSAQGSCPEPGCHEPIDVGFSVAAYLHHHRPRAARGAIRTEDPGWFTLRRTDVRFRVPLVGDLLGVGAGDGEEAALRERCVIASGLPAASARRLDRALAALSPHLEGLIAGTCPACECAVQLWFEPSTFVLAELRDAFSPIYLETHLLAASYGWDEAAILSLPRSRRRRYAGIAAGERAAA